MTRFKRKTKNESTDSHDSEESSTSDQSEKGGFCKIVKDNLISAISFVGHSLYEVIEDVLMIKNNFLYYYRRDDSEIKDLISEYSDQYLNSNWRISSVIWFVYWFFVLIIIQFMDRNAPIYKRAWIICPIFMSGTILSRMIYK